MKHLDLFTGIGGFSLAARWAGIETIGMSEIDPYCCELLEQHFPEIPNYGDIFSLDGRTVDADLITGGFPCQPYSLAGKQQGQNDRRDLWPQMYRVVSECEPTWVCCENVVGFIHMALERVCADLEGLGFEVTPCVIPACAVGAPHRRDRIWILAYSARNRAQKSQRSNDEGWRIASGGSRLDAFGSGAVASVTTSERRQELGVPVCTGGSHQTLPDADGSRPLAPDYQSQQMGVTGQPWFDRAMAAVPAHANGELHRRGHDGTPPAERDEAQTNERGWESVRDADFRLTQSPLCGRDDGVSRRVDRLKALGNAVVPQLAYQILKTIKDVDDGITQTEVTE